MSEIILDREFFDEPEASELIDELNASTKNRILWKIFSKLFNKKGSFIRTFGQLMWFAGYYHAYKDYYDYLKN